MTEHLLPVLCCHDAIRPAWCYDIEGEKSENCSKNFGLQALSSLEDAIDPSVVVSAVRPTSSAAVIEAGNHLNCPVFLEKPGGLTTDHLNELEILANRLSVDVWFGYNYRYSNMAQTLRSIVDQDRPIIADYEFYSRRPLEIENGEPTLFESWMRGNSVHLMDFISYIHNCKPKLISSTLQSGEDGFLLYAQFRDDDGGLINLKASNITQKFVFRSNILTVVMSG